MPPISLCMIVKDEEEVLARCLDSIIELVDEIIIVDTGSTDATLEIAARYGAKTHSLEWKEDFSEARNFSFEQATCPYIIWLDADDQVLPDELAKLQGLKQRLDKDVYYLRYDYAQDHAGNSLCTLYRERVVRNDPRIRWIYPVHECLLVSPEHSSERADATITHRRTVSGARTDAGRNLRILEQAINKEGNQSIPRLRYYLAREYQDAGLENQALDAYRAFLDMQDGWVEDRVCAQQRIAQCYYELAKKEPHNEAQYRSLARSEAKRAKLTDDRWAEPYFLLGQIAFDEQDFEEAVFWFEKCLRPAPSVFSPVSNFSYGLGPAVQLCLCHDKMGDFETANRYNELALSFRPEDAGLLYNREYFRQRLAHNRGRQGPIRLNLGSGKNRYGDYLICDKLPGRGVDEVFSPDEIPYEDNSVDAIHAEHAIERLCHADARQALREWHRVLKAGGEVILKLPDLEACCRGFLQAKTREERDRYRDTIFGRQEPQDGEPVEGQIHLTGFTEGEVVEELKAAGFVIDCRGKYDEFRTPSIFVRALKPAHARRIGWVGAGQDLRSPQYRIRIYHIDRWLRSRGYISSLIDPEEADGYDTLVFFRRYTKQEHEHMCAAKASGKRVILDVCEDLFGLPFECYDSMIRSADAVVCCSHALAEKVRRINPAVAVIEDAVESDFNLNCAYEDKAELRVGWIGMGGSARFAERFRSMIEGLGYRMVAIHEHQGADVAWDLNTWPEVLAGCDIAIAPTDENVHPSKSNNKITTYMALGLPTIATPLDAYDRIIKQGETGYIARSETEWRVYLQQLSDSRLRERIGQAGKAAARDYHLDVIAERWLQLLVEEDRRAVDIIIPTCGNSPYLRACVESVIACTEEPHRVIVVNSGDPEMIRDLPGQLKVIQSDLRLSFSQALNLGIEQSDAPYVCFMNDDVIVSRGWLRALKYELQGDVGLCNPLSNCDKGWLHDYDLELGGVPLLPGQNILSNGRIGLKGTGGPTIRPEQLYGFSPGYARAYDREWLAFFCTLVSREVIEKVGLLDEEFVNGCEDLDYCRRAAAIGFRCRVNEAGFVFHFGGVSRSLRQAETPDQYLLEDGRNHARVLSKYDRPLLVIHTGHAYEAWTEASIERGGIGGAETAAACMGRELVKQGFRVVVFSDCEGSEGVYSGVEFQALSRFDRFVEMNHLNVFVASRYVNLFDYNIRADKKYLWVHDVWAMGTEFGENDKVRDYYDDLDGIFCLSPWHRDFFAEKHDVSPAKIIISGNGADPGRFDKEVEKQRYRFIYASSPDRGLDTLLDLFPRILREFPEAELHVFYGFDNWDEAIRRAGPAASRDWRDQIYQALNQPGVFYHGRVGQRELAEEFLKSDIWFYPTRFTETYCITALEAQMAGAVCVCSDLAALQTTVGDRGILIPGDPYTEQYRRHALQQVFSILKDDERKRELTNRARDWARRQTWENRAKAWLSAFNSRKLAVSV